MLSNIAPPKEGEFERVSQTGIDFAGFSRDTEEERKKKALAPNQKGRPRLYKKPFQEIKKKKKDEKV